MYQWNCKIKLNWGKTKQRENEPEASSSSNTTTPPEVVTLPNEINADNMFKNCSKIISIDISNFYIEKITSMINLG